MQKLDVCFHSNTACVLTFVAMQGHSDRDLQGHTPSSQPKTENS